MSEAEADIRALFQIYLTAWNAGDIETIASLFTEPTVTIGDAGLEIAEDRDAVIRNLTARFDALAAEDFDHTEIAAVEVRLCDDATAMVNLRNVRRLRKDGSAINELDAVYICNRLDGDWRLSVAMACRPGWVDG